jgi:hypothetical protein
LIIGYARVSTTEQNLGLEHDDLKPDFDASVDQTDAQGDRPTLRSIKPTRASHRVGPINDLESVSINNTAARLVAGQGTT